MAPSVQRFSSFSRDSAENANLCSPEPGDGVPQESVTPAICEKTEMRNEELNSLKRVPKFI